MERHVLRASGAPYVVDYDGDIVPASGFTESGYRATGGAGRAYCRCGWLGNIHSTRKERRMEFKEHHEAESFAQETPEWKALNDRLYGLLDDLHDEDPNVIEKPVFMSPAEKALYEELSPKVIRNLLDHYRKQR